MEGRRRHDEIEAFITEVDLLEGANHNRQVLVLVFLGQQCGHLRAQFDGHDGCTGAEKVSGGLSGSGPDFEDSYTWPEGADLSQQLVQPRWVAGATGVIALGRGGEQGPPLPVTSKAFRFEKELSMALL